MADDFEKRNQEVQKKIESVNETASQLRPTFQKVIEEIKNVNVEVAETAANLRKSSKDTFSGALASRKLLKVQRELANDPELKKVSEDLKTVYEEQRRALEVARKKDAELISAQEDRLKLEAQLRKLSVDGARDEKGKFMSQAKILEERTRISKELSDKNKEVEEREQKIKDTFNNDIEKLSKEEERVRSNATAKLEKASKTEGFDNFADGLKELTGGMLDIAKPLDMMVKKWNAVGQLANGVKSGFNAIKEGGNNLVTKLMGVGEETEDNQEKTNKVSDKLLKGREKGDKKHLKEQEKVTGKLSGIFGSLKKIAAGFSLLLLGFIAVAAIILSIPIALGVALSNLSFAGAGEVVKRAVSGIGQALDDATALIKKGFEKIGSALDDAMKFFKNLFPKKVPPAPKTPPKPTPKPTPKTPVDPSKAKPTTPKLDKVDPSKAKPTTPTPTSAADDVAKTVVKEADEVVEEVAKKSTGFFSGVKGFASGLVKKLPVIGAVAESGFDAFQQFDKMEDLTKAYEAGELKKIDEETGEERAYTEEEFAKLQEAFKANLAGSVGKGAGSFGGAAAGAAVGAAIGSVVPVVGTFIGGLVGAVAGGIMGGKVGDQLATEGAELIQGSEGDSQALIDNAVSSLQIDGDAVAGATTDVAEGDKASQGGNAVMSTTAVTQQNVTNSQTTVTSQLSARNTDPSIGRTSALAT
jgi:outer membrane lipoprotein SlyB/DNA-binding ferritin-like protein